MAFPWIYSNNVVIEFYIRSFLLAGFTHSSVSSSPHDSPFLLLLSFVFNYFKGSPDHQLFYMLWLKRTNEMFQSAELKEKNVKNQLKIMHNIRMIFFRNSHVTCVWPTISQWHFKFRDKIKQNHRYHLCQTCPFISFNSYMC